MKEDTPEGLNRVQKLRQEYIRAEEKLEELETLATHITTRLSDMPKNAPASDLASILAALADHREKYAGIVKRYLDNCDQLERELNAIRNPAIRTAMIRRYVDGMKVEDIAEAMHYERSWVYRLLNKGRKIYSKEHRGEGDK